MRIERSAKARIPSRRLLRSIATFTVALMFAGASQAQLARQRFDNPATGTLGGVKAVVEDPEGFIWLGGEGGLARFDGRQVMPAATAAVRDTVNALALQDRQHLWVGTASGLLRWDMAAQRAEQVSCSGFVEGVGQLQVQADGVLALSRSGLFRIDGKTLTCRRIAVAGLPADAPIERFFMDATHLWLGVRAHGLWRCPRTCTTARPWAAALDQTRIRWLSAATHGGLWVGTQRQGLFRLDATGKVSGHWWRGDDAPTDHQLPTNGVMALVPAQDGSIYVGLWAGGLVHLDADGRIVGRAKPLRNEMTSLGGANVAALLESRTGAIWAGHESGVSVLDPVRNRAVWIGRQGEDHPGLSDDATRALWQQGRRLFVGTAHGGVDRIDLDSHSIVALQAGPGQPGGLPDNAIWDMANGADGTLALGTSGGLVQLAPQTMQARVLASSPRLPSDDVVAVSPARAGGYWIAAWAGGVMRVAADGHILRTWRAADGLRVETMTAVFEDAQQRVWASNDEGLFRLGTDGRFVIVAVRGTPPKGAVADVDCFHQATDGTLWMGTLSGGLLRLDANATVPNWVAGTAWDNASIAAIAARSTGGLWLGTPNGLYAVDAQGRVVRHLGRGKGLEFDSVLALLPDGDGLWVGGNGGLQHLGPGLPSPRTIDRAPQLTGVRVFNQPILPAAGGSLSADPAHGGRLQLGYDQALLSIDFSMPGLPQPAGLKFRYRLRGFDDNWVTVATDEARATFTRLPPGDYTFEVEAGDGHHWYAVPARMAVGVSPPWWMTWWARGAALLAVALLLLLAYRLRTAQLRGQALRLAKVVHQRTAELRRANLALRVAASTDPLTGLSNRRGFLELIRKRWPPLPGTSALVLVDIDHFKSINDRLGHDSGDLVLIEVGRRLQAAIGADNSITRWGGEEFLCLLEGDTARDCAVRMVKSVAATPITAVDGPVAVTITAGFAPIHEGDDFDSVVKRADALLYRGKHGGRNRLVFETGVVAGGEGS